MKACLAFNYPGLNHILQGKLWSQALTALGWQQATVEDCDVVIMWGPNKEADLARDLGKPVLNVDFPYWNRGKKIRTDADYYKITINGQHPTKYIMTEKHDAARYRATGGPVIEKWNRHGRHILIAGMGQKAAVQNGYMPGDWEFTVYEAIKSQTKMPIYYRPKPKQGMKEIPGTIFDKGDYPVESAIKGAHCVICHHGNPTVQALAMGVPIFMNGAIGAASHFASFEFDKILFPVYKEGRSQFFHNLAFWQWSVQEITSGRALQSYVDRGFI